MTKVLKIVSRTLGISLECFLALFLIFAFLIRTSPVQTYMAKRVTNFLSEELKAEVKIDKLDVIFFNRMALDGFMIKDQKKDTLGSFNSITVSWKSLGFFTDKIQLKKIDINQGVAKINRDEKGFNYDFIIDYFKSNKKRKSKPITFFHFKFRYK